MKICSSSSNIKVYFKNGWNKLDFLGIILFIIGFTIHFVSEFTNDYNKNNIFDISRYLIRVRTSILLFYYSILMCL
jgi:hypothetical protein